MPIRHEERCGGDPYFRVDCHRCLSADPRCRACEGEGKVWASVCPMCCYTPELRRAMETYRWVKRGFLPVAGSLLDQSYTFLRAVEEIERLEEHFRSKSAERARREHGRHAAHA